MGLSNDYTMVLGRAAARINLTLSQGRDNRELELPECSPHPLPPGHLDHSFRPRGWSHLAGTKDGICRPTTFKSFYYSTQPNSAIPALRSARLPGAFPSRPTKARRLSRSRQHDHDSEPFAVMHCQARDGTRLQHFSYGESLVRGKRGYDVL